MSLRPWVRELALYVVAVMLCMVGLDYTFQLGKADLRIPLNNEGDGLLGVLCVKNTMERGTYYHSERIAAPYGVDLRDFPLAENLHLAVIRLLGLGSKNPFRVTNYFFLLTYLFTVITAVWTLRQFGVGRLPALVAALLFAFLPYHQFRGLGHLLLSAYYMIPPMVLVCLWVYLGSLERQTETVPGSRKIFWGRWAVTLLICLLVSGAGVYYAFFGCFFLLMAGIARSVQNRRWTPLFRSAALVAVVVCGLILNLLPSLLYHHEQGPNADVAERLKWEADMFGLKLTHLLLPVQEHRLELVRHWKELYSFGGPWPFHEGCVNATLATVGALGFIVVAFYFLFGNGSSGTRQLLRGLGLFAVSGFLLGTVGGLGSLFANYLSPQIRAYNRVSIYLGFFALFGIALLLTWFLNKARRWGLPGQFAASGCCLLLLVGGIWDQTTPAMIPAYAATKVAFESQVTFTGQVEQRLPPGAMVFQYPILDFPEGASSNRCSCYDHFRLYLVSHTLSWSHGTMNGRYGAKVMDLLRRKPIDSQVEQLVVMGYSGIHIDRFGYADEGRELEGHLRKLLGVEPLVSPNGRDVFFTLEPYAKRVRSQYSEEEWDQLQEWTRSPLVALWGDGVERDEGGWRWCRRTATLKLVNPLKETRTVTLRFQPDFATPDGKPQEPKPHLSMTGTLVGGTQAIDPSTPFSQRLTVPPGTHALQFECDAKSIRDANGRTLVFRLLNLEIESDDTPPDRYTPQRTVHGRSGHPPHPHQSRNGCRNRGERPGHAAARCGRLGGRGQRRRSLPDPSSIPHRSKHDAGGSRRPYQPGGNGTRSVLPDRPGTSILGVQKA